MRRVCEHRDLVPGRVGVDAGRQDRLPRHQRPGLPQAPLDLPRSRGGGPGHSAGRETEDGRQSPPPRVSQHVWPRPGNVAYVSGLEDQGEIISCINEFFDVLKSRKTHTFNPLKCAFGRNLQVQVKAIQNMKELLEGPKSTPVPKERGMLKCPFEKGY